MRPDFFFLLIKKCEKKERNRRKNCYTKKEPGLDDLGNSHPTAMAKDTKIRSLLQKVWHRVEAVGRLHTLCLQPRRNRKVRASHHERLKVCFLDPSQSRHPQRSSVTGPLATSAEAKTRKGIIFKKKKKTYGWAFRLMEWIPPEIHKVLGNTLSAGALPAGTGRDRKRMKQKETRGLRQEAGADTTTWLQIGSTFHEKNYASSFQTSLMIQAGYVCNLRPLSHSGQGPRTSCLPPPPIPLPGSVSPQQECWMSKCAMINAEDSGATVIKSNLI